MMSGWGSRFLQRLPALAAALWWGSLSAVGFLAVPLLFANLPSPTVAGGMAARLFEAQMWVGVACCALLLVLSKPRGAEVPDLWARAAMIFVVGGLLLALVQQFGVAPRIVARQDLRLWHSVGSVMYLIQWGCSLATLWTILSNPPGVAGSDAGCSSLQG